MGKVFNPCYAVLMPCTTKCKRVHPVSTSEEVLFASQDSTECMDKHFPSDIHHTPELLVGNAECTGILLGAIDSCGACKKNMCRGEH